MVTLRSASIQAIRILREFRAKMFAAEGERISQPPILSSSLPCATIGAGARECAGKDACEGGREGICFRVFAFAGDSRAADRFEEFR